MYNQIKIVFVGSNGVGKSSIIYTLINGLKFPYNDLLPKVVCGRYELYYNLKNITIAMFESNSFKDNEQYKTLRVTQDYPSSDVIGLCFSISDRGSFDDCYNYWFQEIKEFNTNIPILLISTKSDLKINENKNNPITQNEIIDMVKNLNAFGYIEISSKNDSINLSSIFKKSCDFLYNKENTISKRLNCILN